MEVTKTIEETTHNVPVFRDQALNCDGVDLSVLQGFEGAIEEGEPDLAIELIDIYLDDVPQKLKSIRDALFLADLHSLQRAAHNLKGSRSSPGAFQFAALCDRLEAHTTDLPSQDLDMLLTSVEQEFERVYLFFTAERKRRSS